MKKFTTLRHILPTLFRERQWQDAWQVQSLYSKWPHIAGEEAARHSRPVALRGQTLWLYVSHAIWAQELLFRQRELLRRIRPLAADRSNFQRSEQWGKPLLFLLLFPYMA